MDEYVCPSVTKYDVEFLLRHHFREFGEDALGGGAGAGDGGEGAAGDAPASTAERFVQLARTASARRHDPAAIASTTELELELRPTAPMNDPTEPPSEPPMHPAMRGRMPADGAATAPAPPSHTQPSLYPPLQAASDATPTAAGAVPPAAPAPAAPPTSRAAGGGGGGGSSGGDGRQPPVMGGAKRAGAPVMGGATRAGAPVMGAKKAPVMGGGREQNI